LHKRCSKCRHNLCISNFSKDKHKLDGLQHWCKDCRNNAFAAYYSKTHRTVNRVHRLWAMRNRDKMCRYARNWQLNNPDAFKAIQHRKRARRRQAAGYFTANDVSHMRIKQSNKCYYCGRNLKRPTIDHKVPLIRGGTNWPSNLCLACQSCNDSKGKKTIQEFKEMTCQI
jgi:hypothetical protein